MVPDASDSALRSIVSKGEKDHGTFYCLKALAGADRDSLQSIGLSHLNCSQSA